MDLGTYSTVGWSSLKLKGALRLDPTTRNEACISCEWFLFSSSRVELFFNLPSKIMSSRNHARPFPPLVSNKGGSTHFKKVVTLFPEGPCAKISPRSLHPYECYTSCRMQIDPNVRIGHIHLTVSDLDRALAFYHDILGFDIVSRLGDSAVFLSAGGYHHHIGLNTWAGRGATPPPPGHTGLYHAAILYPTRKALAQALQALIAVDYPIEGFADHGVSEAIYLHDPDGNGVELYTDRPREMWQYNSDGTVHMVTEPLDVEGLLTELQE